jgi:nicotinamidase-related amidase
MPIYTETIAYDTGKAHVCVSTTARQASDKGWEVLIVRDGVGDRDIPGVDGVHLTEVVLNELKDVFGTVIDSHEIS